MRLADGSTINNIARLEKSEEIEKESQKVDEEIKNDEVANPTEKKEERASLDSEEESF